MEYQELSAIIDATSVIGDLFDRVPDVVFFIKDRRARYRVVNQTLADRCGVSSKEELLGRTTREVFPEPLGNRYYLQDMAVFRTGRSVTRKLELHVYPGGVEGWCLTDKLPMTAGDGEVIGLAGVSRDLRVPSASDPGFQELAASVDHVQASFGEVLRVEELARMAGLSEYQFNRRIRSIFQITAGQLITKTRIDAASDMLRSSEVPIAEIALRCGYFDQSAFTRVFRRTVGVTPQQYRDR